MYAVVMHNNRPVGSDRMATPMRLCETLAEAEAERDELVSLYGESDTLKFDVVEYKAETR